ncbi:MAG: sodium:solute symporter family protein [candidate division KSB1 bacterium]|nr:sodium:solute symporter family protein [candidate division KSB1 bacterium]MDZ7335210.1 sodium:solute symporter family protein [candidate division KSB1 bacterium]MDZ7357287.1 sodium:solute symporter family protein [candidate division KSB1 bacterium]MDZ7401435.1 sodium:solute symporter family protein [candidate division KSB1 bacterium]
MYLLGLHLWDWILIIAYFSMMIFIGTWTRRRVKNTKDFYQGGRSFGKFLTTAMHFGTITSADQAAGVAREIYRQGLSGMWFQNLPLLFTPFYWFVSILQRRARYVGPGDIYLHRFESKFLAGLFATYILLNAIYGGSIGYLLTGKTMQAMMVKPETEYTAAERRSVDEFYELQRLQEKQSYEQLSTAEQERLDVLVEKQKRGELHAYISYLNLNLFYFLYAGIVASYTMLGGLFAAVLNDVIQSLLILVLSFMLLPIGLSKLGGFTGLHQKVPAYMFEIFGSAATSEYTWYFVVTFATLNLIILPPRNFTYGGSPKDDFSARMGMVTGALIKRFTMIGWALTGLIAVGLYQGQLSDPTNIWGHMTKNLLGAGFVGLMIAAIMAANMSTISANSLEWSAAFTKNIFLPLVPQASEKLQIIVGRLVIFVVMFSTIYFAKMVDDIFVVFKYVLSIGTIIGPALWLVYFWRRLTTKAVVVQMLLSIMLTVVVPNLVPSINNNRENPKLTIQTVGREEVIQAPATAEDVKAGRASFEGQLIEQRKVYPPTGIYFETVARKNPDDPNSPLEGRGIFRVQLYLISMMGFDLTHLTKAQLATLSNIFDIIFPFIILILVSLITKPNSEKVLREFYACIHTPAHADQTEDARRVKEAIEHPELVEKNKLFPGTNWEFWKPTKQDIWGFVICWLLVGLIIWLYTIIMKIGA